MLTVEPICVTYGVIPATGRRIPALLPGDGPDFTLPRRFEKWTL